jgi:hypothetical protein
MRIKTIALTLATLAAFSSAAHADTTNLVTNGDFSNATVGQFQNGNSNAPAQVAGWTSAGYNFVFAANGADNNNYLELWSKNNGGVGTLANSPTGGNFIGADGAFSVGALSQTINGLVAGQQYTVSFDWAAGQQKGFDGTTTEQWAVDLGNKSLTSSSVTTTEQKTAVYTDASHSSSSWMHETMTFTATGASEVLSFLAIGTPDGKPPFSLLDGVSMVAAVPEPSEWAMLFAGLGLIGFMARRRKANAQ